MADPTAQRRPTSGGYLRGGERRAVIPGWFIANPLFSSIALEHLIVARTTACGCGTVRVEKRGGARSGGLNGYAAPMDWNFLFLGCGRCPIGDAKNNYSGQRKFCPD